MLTERYEPIRFQNITQQDKLIAKAEGLCFFKKQTIRRAMITIETVQYLVDEVPDIGRAKLIHLTNDFLVELFNSNEVGKKEKQGSLNTHTRLSLCGLISHKSNFYATLNNAKLLETKKPLDDAGILIKRYGDANIKEWHAYNRPKIQLRTLQLDNNHGSEFVVSIHYQR